MAKLTGPYAGQPIPPFSRELHDNYRATAYHCHYFRIRPGVRNPDFESFILKNGWETFTFITAWNPFSASDVPLVENERRQAALVRELTSKGLPFLPAVARDLEGAWPEEPGMFVFEWKMGQALETGLAYGQNAVLRGKVGGVAEVLWCHGCME